MRAHLASALVALQTCYSFRRFPDPLEILSPHLITLSLVVGPGSHDLKLNGVPLI